LVLCADNPAVTAMTATDVRAGHRAPAPVVAYSEPPTLEIDTARRSTAEVDARDVDQLTSHPVLVMLGWQAQFPSDHGPAYRRRGGAVR